MINFLKLFLFLCALSGLNGWALDESDSESHKPAHFEKEIQNKLNEIESELERLSFRRNIVINGYKLVTAALFLAPYSVYYYNAILPPFILENFAYYFTPVSLGTYYVTIPPCREKTAALCDGVFLELNKLSLALKSILMTIKMTTKLNPENGQENHIREALLYFAELNGKNKLTYQFIVDVFEKAWKKYPEDPEILEQPVGISVPLRLVTIYIFLRVFSAHEKFVRRFKMASIGMFEAWEIRVNSYSEFVEKCAEKLHGELHLLKASKESVEMRIEHGSGWLEKDILKLLIESRYKGSFEVNEVLH